MYICLIVLLLMKIKEQQNWHTKNATFAIFNAGVISKINYAVLSKQNLIKISNDIFSIDSNVDDGDSDVYIITWILHIYFFFFFKIEMKLGHKVFLGRLVWNRLQRNIKMILRDKLSTYFRFNLTSSALCFKEKNGHWKLLVDSC